MILKRGGFTILEALVVIIVFILMVVILTPFVQLIRERSHIINCANNLRRISIGLHMYAADHDDAFPPDLGSLYPGYVREEQVFDCPANKFIGTAAKSDYEYISGLSELSMPVEVIIYDRDGNHNSRGRNIVRVNGSVEWAHSAEGKPR